MIGGLTTGLSPRLAMDPRLLGRKRRVAHSWFCLNRIAPINRTIAAAFGKTPGDPGAALDLAVESLEGVAEV